MSKKTRRAPQAFTPDDKKVVTREYKPDPEILEIAPRDEHPVRSRTQEDKLARGIRWGGLFISAIAALVCLTIGIWINDVVSGLLARQDWVGWTALGLTGIAILAAVMMGIREIWAILRLRRLGRIRQNAEKAVRQSQKPLAETVASDVRALYRNRRDLAWARARLAEHDNEIVNAEESLALVERELVTQLDREAQAVIAETAKRVSVITAISPVAVLDMAIVAVQNLRMLRRIATAYGARPGTVGLLRLARMVVAHIVVTGGLALGDDLIQQLIGHRLMAKLSARLGEGLFNGALTARIGLAAIDVCRPLPYITAQPPRMRSILTELARQIALKS